MQNTLDDVILFKQASWEELKRGDVIFDLANHDDVQHVLLIGKKKKLIKFEDLGKGIVKWYTKLRYSTKNYYYLEK
jgi:hypothetical protein